MFEIIIFIGIYFMRMHALSKLIDGDYTFSNSIHDTLHSEPLHNALGSKSVRPVASPSNPLRHVRLFFLCIYNNLSVI